MCSSDLHFGKLSRVGGELRPGIVHRLDKETSGLLLVAKKDSAHRRLAEQFSGRAVKKTYVALVHGWPRQEKGTVSSPISRDRVRRIRMTTRRANGREATTHFQTQQKLDTPWGKFALLEMRIETGRTHQIRAHFAAIGYPLAGDPQYGHPGRHGLTRQFLHSARLGFTHPFTDDEMEFSSALPDDLAQALEVARAG